MSQKIRTGIGQDSHRFLPPDSAKPCIIGGIIFNEILRFMTFGTCYLQNQSQPFLYCFGE